MLMFLLIVAAPLLKYLRLTKKNPPYTQKNEKLYNNPDAAIIIPNSLSNNNRKVGGKTPGYSF